MSEPSCDKRGHIMSPTSPRCGVCGVYSSQMMLVTREAYEQTRQRLAAAEAERNVARDAARGLAALAYPDGIPDEVLERVPFLAKGGRDE